MEKNIDNLIERAKKLNWRHTLVEALVGKEKVAVVNKISIQDAAKLSKAGIRVYIAK